MNLSDLITSIGSLAGQIITALVSAVVDAILWVTELVLQGIAFLLVAIPTPCCVAVKTLGQILQPLPLFAKYAIGQMDFGPALVVLSCGFTFYMARKLVTLFQW